MAAQVLLLRDNIDDSWSFCGRNMPFSPILTCKSAAISLVPIELNQAEEDWRACAEIDATGRMIGFHRREWQAWLAEFVETEVVPNLIRQGWLEHGVKSDKRPPTYTVEQMRERGYLLEEESISPEELEEVWHDIPF